MERRIQSRGSLTHTPAALFWELISLARFQCDFLCRLALCQQTLRWTHGESCLPNKPSPSPTCGQPVRRVGGLRCSDSRPGSLTCQMHVTIAKFLPLSKVE